MVEKSEKANKERNWERSSDWDCVRKRERESERNKEREGDERAIKK